MLCPWSCNSLPADLHLAEMEHIAQSLLGVPLASTEGFETVKQDLPLLI